MDSLLLYFFDRFIACCSACVIAVLFACALACFLVWLDACLPALLAMIDWSLVCELDRLCVDVCVRVSVLSHVYQWLFV